LREKAISELAFAALFADDLVVIGNIEEINKTIDAIENWAAKRNMVVNKKKSGLMFIKHHNAHTTNEYRGYPIVQSYKYLGYYINDKGTIDAHMKETTKKFNFIKWRLTGLRNIRNLKLNINLFKILIMPQHRLAAATYHRQTEAIRQSIQLRIRVQFKMFCNLPINLADHTFELLFGGSVETIMQEFVKRIGYRLDRHHNRKNEVQTESSTGVTKYKKFPMRLTEMLFRLYTSKCNRKGCAGHITNTTHLREVHKFNVNVRAILEQFKDKKTKATARLTVIRTIEFIERIRVKTARK
jgi:hypothetical protein